MTDTMFWKLWLKIPFRFQEWLVALTMARDEHPEDFDGPCLCKLCMSYADL